MSDLDKFQAGKDRYPWPEHWRGIAFLLNGMEYRLEPTNMDVIDVIRGRAEENERLRGYPMYYAVVEGVIEIAPTPHCDVDVIQAPEWRK